MDPEKMAEAARNAAGLMKLLANENRLMILCQLADGEKPVGELAALIGLGQSPLSQHLARLRQDGLVTTRRDGQSIYYSLASDEAGRVIRTLYEMYCAPAAPPTSDAQADPSPARAGRR